MRKLIECRKILDTALAHGEKPLVIAGNVSKEDARLFQLLINYNGLDDKTIKFDKKIVYQYNLNDPIIFQKQLKALELSEKNLKERSFSMLLKLAPSRETMRLAAVADPAKPAASSGVMSAPLIPIDLDARFDKVKLLRLNLLTVKLIRLNLMKRSLLRRPQALKIDFLPSYD